LPDLVCDIPATPLRHVQQQTDAEKAIRRIDYISRVGVYLLKGGMGTESDDATLRKHLEFYALGRFAGTYTGNEKLLQEDCHIALQKANQTWFEPSNESFADMVRSWVSNKQRQWTVNSGYAELRLLHPPEKSHFRTVIARMLKEGKIIRVGNKSGVYRSVDKNLKSEDWQNAPEGTVPIWLPFELSGKVAIPPGNILLFSGSQGAGKTAVLMNMVYENMKNFECHYFSSEIGQGTFRKRAAKFPYSTTDQWNVSFYKRSVNFEDVVKKGENVINFIDYMEVHADFWRVGEFIHNIHQNLGDSTCVIALQKDPNSEFGRGGSHGQEKPELSVSLDSGKARVTKVREFIGDINPNGKEYHYKLVNGCQIIKTLGWHVPQEIK
jgi:hypothetical protein